MTADLTPAQAARLEAANVVRAVGDDYEDCDAWVREIAAALTEAEQRGRRLAVAAIDVMRGATDDGVIGRVEALLGDIEGGRLGFPVAIGPLIRRLRDIGAPATAEGGGQ